MREKWSNFLASFICYNLMPLTPFVFEYFYSKPHNIMSKSVVMGISMYAFGLAFGTKYRLLCILYIATGFVSGGLYGTYGQSEIIEFISKEATIVYALIFFAFIERMQRHLFENEECWLYTIFVKR